MEQTVVEGRSTLTDVLREYDLTDEVHGLEPWVEDAVKNAEKENVELRRVVAALYREFAYEKKGQGKGLVCDGGLKCLVDARKALGLSEYVKYSEIKA